MPQCTNHQEVCESDKEKGKESEHKNESEGSRFNFMSQIILWEHPVHPGLIFVSTSLLFLPLYICDAPIIFGVTVLVLVYIVIDIVNIFLTAYIVRTQQCKDTSNKELTKLCSNLGKIWAQFQSMKVKDPARYYVSITVPLLGYGCISFYINNWIVMYATVLLLLSVPGLSNRNWLRLKHG